MWPFKKRLKKPSDAATPQSSREELMRLFQEQARKEGLEPLPDDAEIIVMPGAMTGEEAKRWEAAMRQRRGLPQAKRPNANDSDED